MLTHWPITDVADALYLLILATCNSSQRQCTAGGSGNVT